MTLEFMPEASAELQEAAEEYESRQEGLGWQFRSEVLEVCRLIVQQPVLWRERQGGYRRVNCPVFPYYIAYVIRGDRIVIMAVAHGHRRPAYWHVRLQAESHRTNRSTEPPPSASAENSDASEGGGR